MLNQNSDILSKLQENRTYANYLFTDTDLRAEMLSGSLKIAVLRNYTVEMLLPVIRGELALLDTYGELYISDFDVVMQEAMDAQSQLYTFKPDVICVMLDYRMLSPQLSLMSNGLSSKDIADEKERVVSYYKTLLAELHKNGSASIVVHNLFSMGIPSAGILDMQRDTSEVQVLTDINRELFLLCKQYSDTYLLDLHTLIYAMGWSQAFDARAWHLSKNPYSKKAMLSIGQEYGKFLQVMLGHIRKCVVLDCDNTLWGGIVGETGCHGITLGHDYPGNCYQSLQREVLQLYHRGILVALCSKNNEEDVMEVFRENREMLLTQDHIATYEINWQPKPDNLRSIAKKLNIGLDSLVFVDDSEYECEAVRTQLPEVAVIHLSCDPSNYAETLRTCGLFNALSYTHDDEMRNQNYKAEEKRSCLRERAVSMEDYLSSLGMETRILVNVPSAIPRIAQMTQKTNQFNLTTIRYTEANIRTFMDDSEVDVIAISVKDKISDLGIIGVMIMRYDNDAAVIDTMLLSCRALGRHIEDVLFAYGVNRAREKKISNIIGKYIPTKKNMQVSELYTRLGLGNPQETADGSYVWNSGLPIVVLPDYIVQNVEGE